MTSFKSGMQALQDSIRAAEERAKAAREGAAGAQSYGYFSWKNKGEKKVLRFLTDEVITEKFYDFILDKTGSVKTFLVDPNDPDMIKRYTSPFPGIGWRKNWGTGQLEEAKPKELGVGIAVLRHEIRDPNTGKLVVEDVLTDRTVEDDKKNKVVLPARSFGIVQMNPSNFWHTLATSCLARYGTITDRDYEITREGEGFNTKYNIIPLEQDPDLATPEAVQAFYFYGQPWDPEDPQRFLKCPVTMQQWAEYFASEERMKRLLTPDDETPAHLRFTPGQVAPATPTGGRSPSGLDEFNKNTTQNDEAQAMAPAVSQPSGTSFSSLKDTLLGGNK